MARSSVRGFSIIELIVAVAIVGIVAAGITSWATTAFKNAASATQNEIVLTAMERVTSAFLDNDLYCTENLIGTPLSGADPVGATVPRIDFYDLDRKKVGNVLKDGQEVGRLDLSIESMRLRPVSVVTPAVIIANLEITFAKSGTMGPTRTTRYLPIYAVVENGRVFRCSTSPSASMIISERMCSINSDGYAYYDPITDGCVDYSHVQWIPSADPFQASCPVGWKLAASSLNPSAGGKICDVVNGTTGPAPPRSFTDGTTTSGAIDVSGGTADFTTNTCYFDHAAGVDLSHTTTRVKCSSQ